MTPSPRSRAQQRQELTRRESSALDSPHHRTKICLDCRTALRDGESCDAGPKHRLARLDDSGGVELARSEVWGPASARRRAWQLIKSGGGGATLGSVLETCGHAGGCDVGASLEGMLIGLVVLVLITVAVVGVVWVVLKVVEYVRIRRNTPKPHGALDRPARVPRLGGVPGVVEADTQIHAIASNECCVAWAMELRMKRHLGSAVMLRDAGCGDFRVRLADGAAVHIPAGRLRLRAKLRRVSDPHHALEEYLRTLEPQRGQDEDFDAIPYDQVWESRLMVGDRVLMFGDLERVEAVQQVAESYREAAPAELRPRGVPILRVRGASSS